MKLTPAEIRNHRLKKRRMGGYEANEVDAFKELIAQSVEEAARETAYIEEKLRETQARLSSYIENEASLKDAVAAAQKIVDDIRANARKEAEIIIAESKVHGDEIVRQAQKRVQELNQEIYRLKHQRLELESSLKSILDYHTAKLLIDEVESKKADENADKVRYLPK